MNSNTTYYLHGYDKDADIYETICESPLLDHMITIAKSTLHYHEHVEPIRRFKTQEPFDWFIVTDQVGTRIKVFTAESPEGINPELFEKKED